MAIIELNNIYSKVVDASPKAIRALDEALAVETPGCSFTTQYRTGRWDGKTRFLKKGKSGCKFPTGLLTQAYDCIKKFETVQVLDKRHRIDYIVDDKIELIHKELGIITLRDYQYEAVCSALESTRGVVNLATNAGKTECACGIIKSIFPYLETGQTIAFFTSSKEIFGQSHKRLQERLGTKIGMIGSGKWEVQAINLVMIPTIAKYITKPKKLPASRKQSELFGAELKSYEKEQWAKIDENVKKTKEFLDSVVAMIGDEVHHASSTTWYDVFMSMNNAYYRFGLTGTVDEGNEINMKRLFGCTGKIISKVSNSFLIENGYSAKPTIYMLRINASPIVRTNYPEARRTGIIECDVRNEVFANKIIERANSGKQCLVIANETEHGQILYELLKDRVSSLEFSHGKKTTKYRDECLDSLKNRSLQVLIATTILDEGVDVSGINCLFLVAGGKSMRQLLQRVGRGLRKKEDGSGIEVYDALDYHNQYLVEHTLERYNTYVAEEFEVIKV